MSYSVPSEALGLNDAIFARREDFIAFHLEHPTLGIELEIRVPHVRAICLNGDGSIFVVDAASHAGERYYFRCRLSDDWQAHSRQWKDDVIRAAKAATLRNWGLA